MYLLLNKYRVTPIYGETPEECVQQIVTVRWDKKQRVFTYKIPDYNEQVSCGYGADFTEEEAFRDFYSIIKKKIIKNIYPTWVLYKKEV